MKIQDGTAIAHELNAALTSLSAAERLAHVAKVFRGRLVFSTSLGMEDQAITHLIASLHLPVSIFTLDTGRLFQETYDLLDATRSRYGLAIQNFYPEREPVEKLVTEKGPNSFYHSVENRKECCFIRKVAPLRRALIGAQVWITGLRAEQSENRQHQPIAEYSAEYDLIKINPMVDWLQPQLDEFIRIHSVPVSALHAKGFPSIGCAPCTRAIVAGEDPRAGRWWWESSKKECGLHEHQISTKS